MRVGTWVLWAVAWAAALGLGCEDGGQDGGRLERVDAQLDFGRQQVGTTQVKGVRLKNPGTAPVRLTALRAQPPFAGVTALPLELPAGGEATLELSFAPDAVQSYAAQVTVESDAAESPTLAVPVTGEGIAQVAVPAPASLDFGDVYLGETGTRTLSLTNAGSAPLTVSQATLTDAPAGLTVDLAPLGTAWEPGETRALTVRFAPTALGTFASTLSLTLPAGLGGPLTVPVSGRAVGALPRLCVQLDGQGTETCTDVQAPAGVGTSWALNLPPACDRDVYPVSGPVACPAGQAEEVSGRLYVRNEGNVSVRYTLQFQTPPRVCEGGTAGPSDFTFSNRPGAQNAWSTGEVELSPGAQSAEVDFTYRPTSSCVAEAAEQALLVWNRQEGATALVRQPQTLLGTVSGQSALPLPLAIGWNCGGGTPTDLPCEEDFFGATNAGSGPFQITDVKLYSVLTTDGGAPCDVGPDGGVATLCDFSSPNPFDDCSRFTWATDPAGLTPGQREVPAATGGVQAKTAVGRLVFGPDGGTNCVSGVCPNTPYCLYARVKTTDPYHPEVISRIRAVARPPPAP